MLSRRDILKAVLLGAGCSLIPFGKTGWVFAGQEEVQQKLVVILLRGAIDGLSVVVPYKEESYYKMRPKIAIPKPSENMGAIDLNGFFGLHPALAPIMPLWENKSLTFIHACGSPSQTRSHFEAQDIMETASPQNYGQSDGWLNLLVQQLPNTNSPIRAISIGNSLPKICMGKANIPTIPAEIKSGRNSAASPEDEKLFSQLYNNNPELLNLYKQGTASRQEVASSLTDEMEAASKNAIKPDAFTSECDKLASVIHKNPLAQVAFLDVGGWDTHINQGSSKGQLASKLENLGKGLFSLSSGLKDIYNNTVILVMSEFGRTVAENGNGGTDHGHGNVIWLMGGPVKGGRVLTKWPGLAPNDLYEKRDLAITVDFREVIYEILISHMKLTQQQALNVIKNYNPNSILRGMI